MLLDEIEAKPQNTKALILDGKDFFYYFTGHTVSGKLTTVSLATLGKSYNKKDGSFDTDKKGLIDNVSAAVEISGLDISNPKEVRGDLHNTIYGLMGGDHESGGLSDPTLLFCPSSTARATRSPARTRAIPTRAPPSPTRSTSARATTRSTAPAATTS